MNNHDVEKTLRECHDELSQIFTLIDSLGNTSNAVPHLTKYAIIKSCGTIELAYKSIIADYCSYQGKTQVKHYLTQKIRKGSFNPSYQNIIRMLKDFDDNWKRTFQQKINKDADKNKLLVSLSSLVNARNEFAHGGNPTLTMKDVMTYFSYSKKMMELLDDVVK